MRHWVKRSAAAAAILLAAVPAYADWPPVRWGMSLDQVLAAMPGAEAREWRGKDHDVWGRRMLAVAPHQDGDLPLKAEFYFDAKDKKLVFVRQTANDPKQCAAWRTALIARYGEGAQTMRNEIGEMQTIRWTDSDGDALLFLYMVMPNNVPYHCHLIDGVPRDLTG